LVMRVGSSAQWSYLVVQAESNELRYVGWVTRARSPNSVDLLGHAGWVASARSCGSGCTVWVT
jgi:hypothetical protein